MTDRTRELLERAIEEWDSNRDLYEFHKVIEEIRAYLAKPSASPGVLSEKEIFDEWQIRLNRFESNNLWTAFLNGVRFAEKHHGISGGGE